MWDHGLVGDRSALIGRSDDVVSEDFTRGVSSKASAGVKIARAAFLGLFGEDVDRTERMWPPPERRARASGDRRYRLRAVFKERAGRIAEKR